MSGKRLPKGRVRGLRWVMTHRPWRRDGEGEGLSLSRELHGQLEQARFRPSADPTGTGEGILPPSTGNGPHFREVGNVVSCFGRREKEERVSGKRLTPSGAHDIGGKTSPWRPGPFAVTGAEGKALGAGP